MDKKNNKKNTVHLIVQKIRYLQCHVIPNSPYPTMFLTWGFGGGLNTM